MLTKYNKTYSGHVLVEVLLAMALFSIIITIVLGGFGTVRDGKVNQKQALVAKGYLDQTTEALRSVRERDWALLSEDGTYHLALNGSVWDVFAGSEEIDGFTRQIEIESIFRNEEEVVVASGGHLDPASKKITVTVAWGAEDRNKIESTYFITRNSGNTVSFQTTFAQFDSGQKSGTNVISNLDGEVVLANNTHARWCSPTLTAGSIDLPDGPPVAVAARAHSTDTSIPNDVLVATSPENSNSIKVAYVEVSADSETPTPTLRGKFTLNPSEYSSSGYVPTGIGLNNDFTTNDLKYYTSSSGKLYALVTTNLPSKEVLAILVNDNNDSSNSEYQDPINKIYKYWTFFNTRIYQGNTSSTPNQDQAPFGYGAKSLAILGDRGYALSGGYLYVFNLANIDSKTVSNGLDMVGCRIELDGYDCQPNTSPVKKYSAGQTGTTWSTTSNPIHADCSDGGNIELYADNDLDMVKVGSTTYAFVAVGGVTNPEFNIVNVTSVPTSSSSPRINNSSCGRISGGNSGWKRISSLDFNGGSGTEEAANSVYANSDGTRAYISSNGGVDANNDGNPDSYQFYIINTSTKTSPRFISGTSSPPTSGYYYGQNTSNENKQLYPRQSLTVLNGGRAVLVGRDGVEDSNDAEEYQVLKMEGSSGEQNPQYCGGVDFDNGFNDLVSVVEADSDSFVYMVANTQEKQLKIIQGGEDGTYVESGFFESEAIDLGANKVAMFNRVAADVEVPNGTSLDFQVATYGDGSESCDSISPTFHGEDGLTTSVYTVSGKIPYFNLPTPNINPARCFKYRLNFTSDSTRDFTPILKSLTVNYSP